MATEKQQDQAAEAQEGVSLLDEIVQEMKVKPSDDEYSASKENVQALIGELLKTRKEGQRIDRKVVEAMISQIDQTISAQVNAVLHHKEFKKLESAWRSLKYLVDNVDFRENIRINMLQATKTELLDDFEDASEIVTSGLYRHVYTAEYGQFGGKPYGAMVANYEFGAGNHDVALLRHAAAVAAMAHAPFLAGTDPNFFGRDESDFTELPHMRDLEAHFEDPRFTKWHGFRESEDARYVGLAMPRFVLRAPYSAESGQVRSFHFNEEAAESNENYLWGNAAFTLATRLADSFAKFRWCPNIIGPRSGGEVDDLPIHHYEAMGEMRTKVPTEVLISERREYELSEQGFIALTMRKDSDNAAFFSANSAQKPKYFGTSEEGRRAETNYRLGTQLPYLFIITRIAHYLKVLQRENIGSWKTARELQKELNDWISQYVVGMDNPSQSVRSANPLRAAEITVEDVPGNAGWYRVKMNITPHIKYMGAFFTLSLVGKLDKE
ncbi:MAG: type VI secretion system contractile sheath large subunit [Deltaproteobacteria bacterium]|nr:type VI secretion system contractile sheath large subunit [Deltaproteobacteria bacterium]